jgi:hypothetical protein
MRLLVLMALSLSSLPGCCKRYENDVAILCDVKAACPGLEEPGISSAELGRKRKDCVVKKLRSSEGIELFAFLSSARSPEEKSARLKAEAQKANVAHCPDAELPEPAADGSDDHAG